MELKRCSKGHSYDPSITPECPECASQAGHTVPLVGVDMSTGLNWDNIPSTADAWGDTGATAPAGGWGSTGPTAPANDGWNNWGMPDGAGKTQPIVHETVAVNPQPDQWADVDSYKPTGRVSSDYNPTMPLNFVQNASAVRPVTGWLVCIKGADKGKDFRLHSDMNYIGRSRNNDVVLASDPTVSRERHAMIAYDPRGKMFFFAPANGSSLVRQNGKPVLSTVELKSGDKIEIGEGTYLFVPLCGEDFEW